jgi:hypothetical protein
MENIGYNPPTADVPVKSRFPLDGEPRPTNPQARKRVNDLTRYDSQTSMAGLLPERDKAGATSGIVFVIAAAILFTVVILRGVMP